MGVVVVNFGSHRLLAQNLGSAGELGPDIRVVVVDNFSTAEERDEVQQLAAARGWHLVGRPDNRGSGLPSTPVPPRLRRWVASPTCPAQPGRGGHAGRSGGAAAAQPAGTGEPHRPGARRPPQETSCSAVPGWT